MAVSIRGAYSLEIAALVLLSIGQSDYNDLVRGSALVALQRPLHQAGAGAGNRSRFTVPVSQPAVALFLWAMISPRRPLFSRNTQYRLGFLSLIVKLSVSVADPA